MPNHWLLLRMNAHPSHPVTHDDPITLRTYLDEAPQDDSDLDRQQVAREDQFVVPSERSIILPNTTNARLWAEIFKEEYDAGAYHLYVWAEPYATAAVGSRECRTIWRSAVCA